MAMSEKQKVRVKWLGRVKKLSIAVSLGLLVWSGYALVNYKPVNIDAQIQKPNASILAANLPKAE